MSLRERAESSPVLYVLGALFSGFLAGLGTYEGILRISKLETERRGSYITLTEIQEKYVLRSELTKASEELERVREERDHALAKIPLNVGNAAQHGAEKTEFYPRSCIEARDSATLNLVGSTDSGYYVLDPDGKGPARAVRVFCDMETNNGGWLRLAEDIATCGVGVGSTIDSLARTEDLNPHGFEFSIIRADWRQGRSWCSGEASTGGWDCSYNFGVVRVDGHWLYDGRNDVSRNKCRGCGYKGFRVPVQRQSTNFFIVDPENFTDTSEQDNGCTAEGVMFRVWIR